jgi:hypothetical protein
VAGHAARHRVDGVAHFRAALFQQVGQFAHDVLRLRHGHAVAGHEDHRAGAVQQAGGLLGDRRLLRDL